MYIERYGINFYEPVCPYCGSSDFGLIDYPVDEEKLVYKDEKFYGLSNKRKKYIAAYNEYYKESIDELFL